MNPPLLLIIGIFVTIVLLVWIGMRRNPESFESFSIANKDFETFQIPAGLPQPVEKYYRQIYGDEIPLIHSFILTGRGHVRIKGIRLPARLRFTHDAGEGYRHYIETTIWGVPVMKVNEHYLNLKARLELPFVVIENDPGVDEAANLGMWSETMMFPGVFLSTEGVSWEAINKSTARLIVPFGKNEDEFVVFFDSETCLIDKMETMRWKNAEDEAKTRWQAQVREWGEVKGWKMPVVFSAQWMNESSPWLIAKIEDVNWNVDISDYIQQEGP